MMKECVILNGQIINIGPWDYKYEEVDGEQVARNPLPDGSTIMKRDMEHDNDRGWYEVGTPPVPSPEEQITTLKARLATAEQASADNALTQQQLIELLIDMGVI